jgi:hypothetical protein
VNDPAAEVAKWQNAAIDAQERIAQLEAALRSLASNAADAGDRSYARAALETPANRSVPTTNHADLNEACEQIRKDLDTAETICQHDWRWIDGEFIICLKCGDRPIYEDTSSRGGKP